jgi:DnaJ-domain-containing protein 1
MPKAQYRPLRYEEIEAPPTRACDSPGCRCGGDFRAPKSRDRLTDYYWFCLEHVRQYNAAWDYYAGMDTAQIEAHIRRDVTWDRPTWPLGGQGQPPRRSYRFHDPFDIFEGVDPLDPHRRARHDDPPARPRASSAEEKALSVLDLSLPITLVEVKARYKQLVKRHHPDANGGDKAAEERLKLINEAYATLRHSLAS